MDENGFFFPYKLMLSLYTVGTYDRTKDSLNVPEKNRETIAK